MSSGADPSTLWHPVAASNDLPLRHTGHAQLLGRELVLWRADDGFVNVWENRCLHRGVRLSIGINDGRELQCRYHGWRYASRTAGCTYIPAHPADAPARTICNRTFPAVEKYGLVWSGEAPAGEVPGLTALDDDTSFGLRNLPVDASSGLVLASLLQHRFRPNDALDGPLAEVEMEATPLGSWAVLLRSSLAEAGTAMVCFVQPVDAARSVIRPVMVGTPDPANQMQVLRHHNAELTALRDSIERHAASLPAPEPMVATIEQVPIHLVDLPEPVTGGRAAPLRVRVARKWSAAEGIAGFELESIAGQLPTFQPGAHIDVHLPNGLVRQYSLTNGPGELGCYRIGVKLDPQSRGGSSSLHETVREGDVLAISEPRNNFPLRRDALRTVLIAGGIGITPLLAMAQALHHSRLNFELHYFAQNERQLAFTDVLDRLGDNVIRHLGLDPAATSARLGKVLAEPAAAEHVYICGPGPMLGAARSLAAEAGLPDASVHFEYFKNATDIDDTSSFEVVLARSALTLQVHSGETVLDVLRTNGVAVPSSCEQGACGTCRVSVLEGDPAHQDVYLTDTERRRGDQMMVCVSRARGDRLVLDV